MKKLWMIFLLVAMAGTIAMRFLPPAETPDNLFVDDVVAACLYSRHCVVNKQGEVVANIEIDGIEDMINIDGFSPDGTALYIYRYYKIPYEQGGLPWFDFTWFNTRGERILDNYYTAYNFKNGIAAVGADGRHGYIDKEGNTVIDFKYEHSYPFNDSDIAPVRIEGLYSYINKNDETVIERQFNDARSVVNGMAIAEIYDISDGCQKSVYHIINEKTRKITKVDYDYVEDFSNGFAAVRKGELYGYINKKGEEVIAPQFTEAEAFGEYGLAPVKTADEKWCYVNEKGKIIMEFENYLGIGSFHNGLAWFADENRKAGYMNKDGEVVIEPVYRAHNGGDRPMAFDFKDDGYAVIQVPSHKYGVIDKRGNIILEPIYSSIDQYA